MFYDYADIKVFEIVQTESDKLHGNFESLLETYKINPQTW